MSEAELHIITARMQGAKRAAAERGELRFVLPVGHLYDEEGQTMIDPDEEVQAAISDLFERLGRPARRTGWSVRSGSTVSQARVWRGVGGRAALGRADASAGARRAVESVLRRGVRVRALPLPALVRPDGTIVTRTSELPRESGR